MQECLWPEAKHDFVEGQHPLGLERGSEGLGQGEGQVRSESARLTDEMTPIVRENQDMLR